MEAEWQRESHTSSERLSECFRLDLMEQCIGLELSPELILLFLGLFVLCFSEPLLGHAPLTLKLLILSAHACK